MTKAQWYSKIRSFLPEWFFQNESLQKAVLSGISRGLEELTEECAQKAFESTFILRAEGEFLVALGSERSKAMLDGEKIENYRTRVRRITSHSDVVSLKAIVDSLLLIPGCEIRQAPQDSPYVSRGSFCSRGDMVLELTDNYFLIVVPRQTHAPYSFADRANFTSRFDFVGSETITVDVFNSVVQAVNDAKAKGVMWGLIEKT